MGMGQWNEIDQPRRYLIKVKGCLDDKWSGWLEGFSIAYEEDSTILVGVLPDQSGLHGLLNKIRDLNLQLLAVEQIDTDR